MEVPRVFEIKSIMQEENKSSVKDILLKKMHGEIDKVVYWKESLISILSWWVSDSPVLHMAIEEWIFYIHNASYGWVCTCKVIYIETSKFNEDCGLHQRGKLNEVLKNLWDQLNIYNQLFRGEGQKQEPG